MVEAQRRPGTGSQKRRHGAALSSGAGQFLIGGIKN